MIIALNGTCTMLCNLVTDIQIAKDTGYDAIEIAGYKLYRYLDQGLTLEYLRTQFEGMPPVAVGYVQDIERQEPEEYAALMDECEKMCSLAEELGCPTVQLLTGPLDRGEYKGLIGMPWPEMRDLTAKNLKALADIGAAHSVGFYLEPIHYSPLGTLPQTLELIDAAGKDNVGLVIDFWHMWNSGSSPDDIAKLDKKLIVGGHICDSTQPFDVLGSAEMPSRAVWTGGGNVPLKAYVDAVLSTGFDGWWSGELFSPKHWELDPWETAGLLKNTIRYLLF